jgi:hypothetical protein
MNTSQSRLQEYITLYLNDLEDYGETADCLLAESALNPLKKLITESLDTTDINIILSEAYKKASPVKQEIIKDFISFIEYTK